MQVCLLREKSMMVAITTQVPRLSRQMSRLLTFYILIWIEALAGPLPLLHLTIGEILILIPSVDDIFGVTPCLDRLTMSFCFTIPYLYLLGALLV